jgi:hypothetical protein
MCEESDYPKRGKNEGRIVNSVDVFIIRPVFHNSKPNAILF